MSTWYDKNIQSHAPYRYVFTKQLNHLASLVKLLSVRLRPKRCWVRVPFKSLELQTTRLFWARSVLTLRQVFNLDSLWISYMTWQENTVKFTVQIKSLQNGSIICFAWQNGLVFVYEISGCRFEPLYSHLNFRYCACFEQGVPWHSDK